MGAKDPAVVGAALRLVHPEHAARRLVLGKLLDRGGAAGSIHAVRGQVSLVAKLYHDPEHRPELREKLTAMLRRPPELPPTEIENRSYIQIAWPTGIIEDASGRLRGFSMPIVDIARAAPLELLLKQRTRQHHGLPASYAFRVVAAYNLAALVAELHRLGHYVIDLKPTNVHVYRDTMMIAALDCDGYSIAGSGGERFPGHQITNEYLAPEAIRRRTPAEKLGQAQDEFALAVILFQLLNNGVHPFQGVPLTDGRVPPSLFERVGEGMYAYGRRKSQHQAPSPASVHTFLERGTRALFDRAFTRRRRRPDALEWKEHLAMLADRSSGHLRRCEDDATHMHFAPGCGWCALEGGSAPRPRRRIGWTSAIAAVRRGPTHRARRALWLCAAALGGVLGWQASPWVVQLAR